MTRRKRALTTKEQVIYCLMEFALVFLGARVGVRVPLRRVREELP